MKGAVIRGDASRIPLAKESVDLVVTSPPYNCGMAYDGVDDNLSYRDYKRLVRWTVTEVAEVLKPGGRAFFNLPAALPVKDEENNPVASGLRWSPAAIWDLELRTHLLYRDTIVWLQSVHAAGTGWGSFGSPNAPNFRGCHEFILVFYKEHWKRGRSGKNDITNEQFTEWSRNVWEMPSTRGGDHPAPFHKELPRRVILMNTWEDDVVLDPFAGTFTTVKVADELGRYGIGVELSEEYVNRARKHFGDEGHSQGTLL